MTKLLFYGYNNRTIEKFDDATTTPIVQQTTTLIAEQTTTPIVQQTTTLIAEQTTTPILTPEEGGTPGEDLPHKEGGTPGKEISLEEDEEIVLLVQKFEESDEFKGKNLDDEGFIISLKGDDVFVYGIKNAMLGEMIKIPEYNIDGIVRRLEANYAIINVFSSSYYNDEKKEVLVNEKVKCTGRILEVLIGPECRGRIINELGYAIDGKGPNNSNITDIVFKKPLPFINRKSITEPLETGIKYIDAFIPIGLGMQVGIIDETSNKNRDIAIWTIMNQKGKNITCIYVTIGLDDTIKDILQKSGAMEYTNIINIDENATDLSKFTAAFTGCTMAEYFRDHGENALIIYDNLPNSYKDMSVSTYSLFERGGRANEEYIEAFTKGLVKGQTGSITSLIISKTLISSIYDGVIYIDSSSNPITPLIDLQSSFSKLGGSVQTRVIKKLSGSIIGPIKSYVKLKASLEDKGKLDMLDESDKKLLVLGDKINEYLKQDLDLKQIELDYAFISNKGWDLTRQAISLFIFDNKYLEDIDTGKVAGFIDELWTQINKDRKDILNQIYETKDMPTKINNELSEYIENFKSTYYPSPTTTSVPTTTDSSSNITTTSVPTTTDSSSNITTTSEKNISHSQIITSAKKTDMSLVVLSILITLGLISLLFIWIL